MVFTTIRLESNKYEDGDIVHVTLKGERLFDAQVLSIKKMRLHDINDFIAGIDTGYSRQECIDIILKMYKKNSNINWEKQILHFILLKKIS
jgi:hypothetical protein